MRSVFLVLSLAFMSTVALLNPAYSLSVICNERNMTALTYSAFTSRKGAESWFPKVISIQEDTVQFGDGNDGWYEAHENSRVRENKWEFFIDSRVYHSKYNRKKNKVEVQVDTFSCESAQGCSPLRHKEWGVYNLQVTYKNCIDTSNSGTATGTSNRAKSAFRNLSVCNRKYVQQFMKSQGLYSGSIDGQWGPSTAAGVNGAKKLSKLKNLSSEQVIAKLSDNLVCN